MEETVKNDSVFSKIMKFIIPLIITVGLCYWMFRTINFNEMMDIIRYQCDFKWIALALVISIFSHIFRALRWDIQLQALGVKAPIFILILSIFGTYSINLIFPRLGELWRSGYISQRQKASFSTVFGSMVADRLADTLTVLIITVVVFLFASSYLMRYFAQNEESYRRMLDVATSPWLWLMIAALFALAWWFLTRKSTPGSLTDRIQRFVKGIWTGFAVIGTMRGKGRWLFYTICLWGCYFVQLYVAFYAFPFTTEVLANHGIIVALVTFVFSSIAMGVPSNGGIGPWQWSVMFALSLYGVDKTDGLAFGNLVLGMSTLLLIALGIFTFIAIMFDKKRQTKNQDTITNTQE